MKTSRLLLIVLVLVLLLLLLNLYMMSRSRHQGVDPDDHGTPNDTTAIPERVKSEAERARMQAYLDNYQQGQVILKTIELPSGEIIDFIDLYSQPALRKHKISRDSVRLAPATLPDGAKRDSSRRAENYLTRDMVYTLTGDTCPKGAIPIRRLTMETLTRFETLEDFFHKGHGYFRPPCGGDGGSAAGHEYAHAERGVDNWGAESILNLWDNYVEKSDEFSLSQIWVARGDGANQETLEAGWQVYRDMYGDWGPHLFIYFTPDNYGDGGGYNLSTGDFVQVNNTVYITGGFTHHSEEHGTQYEIKLLIYKDGTNGSWWLKYGDTWVGYWPRSLFDANGVANIGDEVDFGGEIVNTRTDNRHTRTDMGSGNWPSQGFGEAAFHRNIKFVDTDNFYRNATGLSASRTNANCYDIDLVESSGSWEVYFYFGGSGYNTDCPD